MIDEPGRGGIDEAWAAVVARRADGLESGAVRALTREEADDYLEARSAASSTTASRS